MENHLNICNQFVPYELAVKLKEFGFDEPCFYYYEINGKLETNGISSVYFSKYIKKGTNACVAPLWQQAFDWFRGKYNLLSFIDIDNSYRIYCDDVKNDLDIDSIIFKTYEKARQSCLEKLIEIIKNKNDRSI